MPNWKQDDLNGFIPTNPTSYPPTGGDPQPFPDMMVARQAGDEHVVPFSINELKSVLDKKNSNTNVDFWKIAMRPGKPLIFGKYKNIPFLGLPGNPVSAGVCSLIFLRTSINKILGINDFFPDLHVGILNGELKKNDQRLDFVRACFDKNDKNKIIPFSKQDSSMINLFSKCDCLILRKPFEKKALKNTKVNFIKFPDLI